MTAEVGHGNWLTWLRENFEGSERMAQRYLTVAANTTHVADMDSPSLSLRAAFKRRGHETRELQAALRFCELRIGELLGVAPDPRETGARKGSGATEPLSKDHRHEFRQLAAHRDLVLDAVRNGKLSRPGFGVAGREALPRDVKPAV